MRDSNPRAREGKRFSRPPRYDHFDNPPNVARRISWYAVPNNPLGIFLDAQHQIILLEDFLVAKPNNRSERRFYTKNPRAFIFKPVYYILLFTKKQENYIKFINLF